MYINTTGLRASLQRCWQRCPHLWTLILGLILLLGFTVTPPAQAQMDLLPGFISSMNRSLDVAPVWLDGYRLFHVAAPYATPDESPNSGFAARQRAQEIEQRLHSIVRSGFDPDTLSLKRDLEGNLIVIRASANTLPEDQTIMTVTNLDAQLIGSSPRARAIELMPILRQALVRSLQERQPAYLARQFQKTAAMTVGTLLLSGLMWRSQRRLKKRSRYLQEQRAFAQSTPDYSSTVRLSAHAEAHPPIHSPTSPPLRLLRIALHQHTNLTQQIDINLLKRSLLQASQFLLLGGAVWICLGFFPHTRDLQRFLFSTPLKLVGIALVCYVSVKFLWVAIDKFLEAFKVSRMRDRRTSQRLSQRISTLSWILKGVATSLGFIVTLFISLLILGVNLLPVIAGLGAFALAISLAAQHIVRDFLNGMLILLEDQYAVGDVIVVGNVGGFVEAMSLRLTQLRNDEGRLISIPHSAITVVENLSKEWSRVDFTIDVAYEVPVEDALRVLRTVASQLYDEDQWRKLILEPPEVLGIDEIDHAGILIRVWLKTKPLEQWTVAREFRYRLKRAFEQEGIWVGAPHQTLGFRNTLELRSHHLSEHKPSQNAKTPMVGTLHAMSLQRGR